MANTIREQIILAILSKLGQMTTAKGYNISCGTNVYRAQKSIDAANMPCCVVWPKPETATREYGNIVNSMPVNIELFSAQGTTNPSVVAEKMLGDLIDNITGTKYTRTYTSGGTYEIEAGNTIAGATSGATALVESLTLATGTWAGGDAAGTLTLRRKTGAFQAENLNVGANLNVATIAGDLSASGPITTTTSDLADTIQYESGGTDDYPENEDTATGIYGTFNIIYTIKTGNPYLQP